MLSSSSRTAVSGEHQSEQALEEYHRVDLCYCTSIHCFYGRCSDNERNIHTLEAAFRRPTAYETKE